MKKLIGCLTVACLVSAPALLALDKPVAIFVTSDGAANGMTDPNKGNQDTLKDLRGSLKGRKSIALVETRAAADIVLVVMSRDRAQMTASAFGNANMREVIVRVKFQYKDSETEMSGTGVGGAMMTAGAWKQAAGKVAKQVEQWVEANKATLAGR